MTTNSSPIIFEAYSAQNVRSASFHHNRSARVHPQPSFHSQRGTSSTTSPICRHAQIINNHQNGHFFYNQLKSHHQTHSQNASVNSSSGSSPRLVERCVIVAKQPDGYGLTVSGENPVFVDNVKVGGAAAKAGVREGDQIVKINGMPVSSSNHFEVLRMISAGPNVALTLLGEPLSCDTCRPIFFESGFFEEHRKSKLISEPANKSPNETTDTDELETDDKVEPVRNWVNSGGKHYAAPSTITNASSTRDLTRDLRHHSDDEDDHELAGDPNDGEQAGGQRGATIANIVQLKRSPGELALFLNFAIHHSDPTSSLFYLITDAYQASGASLKELRRYAYEIFSTFLIPNAPLQVPGITQLQIQSIDRILAATANANFHDHEQLKKVFVSSRSRALGSMEEVYAEFIHQRTHGTIKAINIDDPTTRIRIAEQVLFKILEELFQLADNDLDKCDARTLALIMSVATILKVLLNIKVSQTHWEKLLDKCPTFVTASSKSAGVFRMKPTLISKKSIIVKDHQFTLNPVYLTVHCYQCRDAIWGVKPEAYFCQNCDVIVHKQCTGRLTDRCYPATQHKNKTTSSASTSARLRTTSALNLNQSAAASPLQHHTPRQAITTQYRSQTAGGEYRSPTGASDYRSTSVEYRNPTIAASSSAVAPVHRRPANTATLPSDTRSMGYDPTANSRHIFAHMESVLSPSDLPPHLPPPAPGTSNAQTNEPIVHREQLPTQPQVIQRLVGAVHHHVENAKSTSSDSGIGAEMERPVSRSQSMKTKERLNLLEEVSEQPGLESDAESSLAAPSTAQFAVYPLAARAMDVRSVSGSSSQSINQDEARHMIERVDAICQDDSDLEADIDIPPLDQIISWQVLKRIDPKLRKLQESINEFYHTERTHVRNLKVICRFFFKPIVEQKLASREFVRLVFGNLDELLEIHSGMFQKMRVVNEQWKKDPEYDGLYGRMGGTIANFFNGEDGERLQKATSAFCQDQQQGLRMLGERRVKDDQLAAFLIKAESNPLCRKFQLKDLLPVEMQRLAKYPLLLDSILRYTLESSDEFQQYTRATMGAKRLLSAVNTAKRDAENRRYLEELNRKIEMPAGNRPSDIYVRKYFDIMQYRYVYDGDVIWKHSRGKSDMRLILLDHLLLLLTKGQDGKYYMRAQETNAVPLLWLPSVTIEEKPGDKRMFVIFYERDLRSYELQAQSITEKKTWEQLLRSQISVAKDELPHHMEADLIGLMPRRLRNNAQPSTEDASSPAMATASIEPLERVHITMHPALVRANEIVVQQPTILEHARPVMTPSERLTKSDKMIVQALAEKHGIIAEQLMTEKKLTQEEMESIAELLTGMSTIELRNRNPAELALSAIVHVNRLVDSINTRMNNKRQDSDKIGEDAERYLPYVPCYKLTAIAAPLLNHLTALSQVIKEQREELNTLRKEVNKNKLDASNAPDRSVSEETLTETRIIR